MPDLRARCLTAMTDAMVDEAPALFDEYAAASLDALIDVLEEHRIYVPVLKPTTEEARE